MENFDRMMNYRSQGFFCSQVLILMGLEQMGKSNPDLVRAMHGLSNGLGFSGELCGALIGGAALLGLYAGRGTPEQEDDPRVVFMVEDLVKWFKAEFTCQFGGIRCEEILAGNSQNVGSRCPVLVTGVFQKVKDLLVENGFDLSGLE